MEQVGLGTTRILTTNYAQKSPHQTLQNGANVRWTQSNIVVHPKLYNINLHNVTYSLIS